MANLILPRRFTQQQQPQGAADVESWAEGGLVIAGRFDHANKALPIGQSGTVTTDVGKHGPQRTHATGSDFYPTPSTLDALTQYTMYGLTKINHGSSGAYYGLGAKNRNATTLNGVGTYSTTVMYVEHGSGSCQSGTSFLSAINTGDWAFWHITWDGTSVRFYVHGDLYHTASYSAAITAGNGRFCTLSNRDVYNTNGAVALTGILPRWLSDARIRQWAANPWQIFHRSQKVLYFDTAGGGATVDLDGAATAVSTATGALSVSVPLAGAGLSVATASGALSISIPLAGSALSVAAASAALTTSGTADLAGQATATASASGGLSLSIPLAGAAVAQAMASAGLSLGVTLTSTPDVQVRPASVVTNSGWNTFGISIPTALSDNDDTTFAYSTTGGELAVALDSIADPGTDAGHAIYVRLASSMGDAMCNIILHCGGTLVRSQLTSNVPADWTDYSLPLTEGQAALITDYSDLRLTVWRLTGSMLAVTKAHLSIANSARASAGLMKGVPLAGAAVAQAIAAAALSTAKTLAGGSAATASAQASLETLGTVNISGNAIAEAVAAAALTHGVPLTGAAISQAIASAGLNGGLNLSGAALSQATAGATMTKAAALSAIALIGAVAAAALSLTKALAGSATSSAAAAGAMTVNVSLSGVAIANAAANAGLTTLGSASMGGNAVASAEATGTLTQKVTMGAVALTVASASGAVTLTVPISGSAASASMVTGGLDISVQFSGAALAQALAAAGITHTPAAVLGGAAYTTANAGGSLTLRMDLDGDAVAQAIASGALKADALIIDATPGWVIDAPARDWTIRAPARNWVISAPARDWRIAA